MPRQKTFTVQIPPQRGPSEATSGDTIKAAGRVASASPKPPADESETARRLDVTTDILLPEYAIGVGLITREEYENMRREYFTQSQWTLGMIIPLALLWMALALRPEPLSWWLHGLFVLLIGIAFVAGMDRLHNYYAQLQSHLAGRYVAKLLAKEAADAAAAAAKKNGTGTEPPATIKDVRNDISGVKTLLERVLDRPPVTIVNNLPSAADVKPEVKKDEDLS